MNRSARLAAVVWLTACASPPPEPVQAPAATASWEEGVYEYVPPLRGQGANAAGRFVYLYGPADGSGPMKGEAGTYVLSDDTVTNTVTFSTAPEEVGRVYRWTARFDPGDTMAFVLMSPEGVVTGRGRSVRVR